MYRIRFKKVKVGERIYKVYSIGWLARMMGVSVLHLRRMEREGVLPKPILATENGLRYYLTDELIAYSNLYKKKAPNVNGGYVKSGFTEEIAILNHRLRQFIKANDARLKTELPDEEKITDYYKEIASQEKVEAEG